MDKLSPYKKASTVNATWVPYCNISKLKQNKAYLMVSITDTNHAEYGVGKQAVIIDTERKKVRTYLPHKYLQSLNPGDIEKFKEDIECKKYPFLIFREILCDNSYHIDIIQYGPDIVALYRNGKDVPAIEGTTTEMDDPLADAAPFEDGTLPSEINADPNTNLQGSQKRNAEEVENSASSSKKVKTTI